MVITLSHRCQNITPSMTLSIDARAKEMRAAGLNVIGFGVGEPDFPTPQFICDAAKEAIDKGMTRYTPPQAPRSCARPSWRSSAGTMI